MNGAVTLVLLKVSILLAAALIAARLLHRAPAARRHGVWSAAFVALVALPVLALTMPAVRVPVPGWASPTAASPLIHSEVESGAPVPSGKTDAVLTTPVEPIQLDGAPRLAAIQLPSLRAVAWSTWLAGFAAALLALLLSLARVRRLEAGGKSLDNPDWRRAIDRISTGLGFRRHVRVMACDGVATPMAGGLIRPTVFVPADAVTWDAVRRDVVLAHEIAHLASRDPLRILVSRLACTLYWFHPLAWLAARQSASDCEQACDEAVLALGILPSTYARVLLDFADGPPLPSAALPMVRRSRLETRLMAILDSTPRPSNRRRAFATAVTAAALTLSLAAVQPATPADQLAAAVVQPAAFVVQPAASSPASPVVPPRATEPATPMEPTVRPAALTLPHAKPTPAVPYQVEPSREEACWSGRNGRSFSGSTSMSGSTIYEMVGRRGRERVIMKSFSNVRLCMVTEGFTGDGPQRPSQWMDVSDRVVLETDRPGDVRRMEVADGRVSWTVNGRGQPLDAAAGTWRDQLLAVLDLTWDVSQLRGQVSTLRGEISTIRGERSSLLGEISTLRGEVSTMRGDISTLRGEESSLRGEISSIRGHVSTLRGQISSERGAISSLQAAAWDRTERDDISARIRRHEDEIRRIEAEIQRYDESARVRAVERRIEALDTERRVEAIERRIRDFDVEPKVAAINRQIAELEVGRRVSAIEGEIESLDADTRVRELESRRDAALARLLATLGVR